MKVKQVLESINLTGYMGEMSLTRLVKLTGVKAKSTRKADIVNALCNFYTDPNSLVLQN
jgi:hypothetical protein